VLPSPLMLRVPTVPLMLVAGALTTPALAHGGGLNACGCHFDRKTGECHCHRETAAGAPANLLAALSLAASASAVANRLRLSKTWRPLPNSNRSLPERRAEGSGGP